MRKKRRQKSPSHFPSVRLKEVPDSRSKHREIVSQILDDLRKLNEYSSIKVDLIAAGKNKAELRAALHRAAKEQGIKLSTASDETNLYVFRRRPK